MAYDAFISYARSDGAKHAAEIERILNEHDVTTYVDTSDPSLPGRIVTEEIERVLRNSRVFVAVLSNEYEDSAWTKVEYEMAVRERKTIVPIILGSREAISWLQAPKWFDKNRIFIEFGSTQRDQTVAVWSLVEATAPAQLIIEQAESVAGKSLLDAVATIDQLLDELAVSGFPRVHVLTHKAQLLRLAGKRQQAMDTLRQFSLSPAYPFQVVQKALVTAAALLIDFGDFVEARARLSEAAAVLSRQTSWRAEDSLRRKLLAEVTRELARSYLDETYGIESNPALSCFQLETAWSVYMEALALVPEDEDILGHAWIHENLGSLATLYAVRSVPLEKYDSYEPITGLDYPAITRFRGSLDNLAHRSRYHLDIALRLFQRLRDRAKKREGEAWTQYHRIQTDMVEANYSDASLNTALIQLEAVTHLFEGITEGEGLTYAELFKIARRLGRNADATKFGSRAVHLLQESEKHQRLASNIEKMLTE